MCMVDLLRSCGGFTAEEAREYIEIGALNGLFVLGRSIGFIGHHLDQKRLKQGLYRFVLVLHHCYTWNPCLPFVFYNALLYICHATFRHPWDDISFVAPDLQEPAGRE